MGVGRNWSSDSADRLLNVSASSRDSWWTTLGFMERGLKNSSREVFIEAMSRSFARVPAVFRAGSWSRKRRERQENRFQADRFAVLSTPFSPPRESESQPKFLVVPHLFSSSEWLWCRWYLSHV